MTQRVVKVRKAWKSQTPRVSFPVTIIKPNGERFTVAPTGKRVAKRKAHAKRKAKQQPIIKASVSQQDTRAIELELRRQAFAESQRKLELEMRGAYN